MASLDAMRAASYSRYCRYLTKLERPLTPDHHSRTQPRATTLWTTRLRDELWPHHDRVDVDTGVQQSACGEGDPFGGPVAMRLGVGGSWSTVERIRLG